LPVAGNATVEIVNVKEIVNTYITLDPPPTIYDAPQDISSYASNNVVEVTYTDNGITPTFSKYLAYDNLCPKNPFIAVVEDGRGNVLFDGGFPKWYNMYCNTNWSVFSSMSASFKYFANALEYIANPKKVAAGNKKILVLGDRSSGNYIITSTATTSFKTSINKVCSIMGYTPTYKTVANYSGKLNPTYDELDQYCAVLFFSTLATTRTDLITPSAILNLVNYREAGNGIFFITDHGQVITSIDRATRPTTNSFFATANQVTVHFGTWFSGNYNRSPVNVGYLRMTYGNHPLWNNLKDTESIHAGGSESRVFITTYDYYSTNNMPKFQLTEPGYTTYKFLIRLVDNTLVSEAFTYGLYVDEIVEFVNSDDTIIENPEPTILNNRYVGIKLIPRELKYLRGVIKYNNKIIGEIINDSLIQQEYWHTAGKSNFYIKSGDVLTIQLIQPFEYVRSFAMLRYQPDVWEIIDLGQFITTINKYEFALLNNITSIPSELPNSLLLRNAIDVIRLDESVDLEQWPKNIDVGKNVRTIKQYISDQIDIPETIGQIYNTTIETNSKLVNYTPPTMKQIFDTWGVFGLVDNATQGRHDEYYSSKSLAPNRDPYQTWVYNTTSKAVVQTYNTNYYTGFVSIDKYDNYIHEVTLSAGGNADDDWIGAVIAHTYDPILGRNEILLVGVCQNVGTPGLFSLQHVNIDTFDQNAYVETQQVLDHKTHDTIYTNPGSTGWKNKRMRIRVVRVGDKISVIATKWNQLQDFVLTSKMSLDLSTNPQLSMFRGPQSYGYWCRSEANSTYSDIHFEGGLNKNLIADVEQNICYIYKNNTWINSGLTVQETFNYPRYITNPDTGQKFYITEHDIQLVE
jgi:hypothetical protein